MSIFKMPTLGSFTSRFERLRDRLGRDGRQGRSHLKHRRLLVDPLEERQLLSVTASNYTDILVNETVSEDQITVTGYNQYGENTWDVAESMAMDDDGDFVVTWTRYDPVYDEDGNYVTDPTTGEIMQDANVYARYFTDEVQRITIPDELVVDEVEGSYSAFYIKYGGNEIQEITISATAEAETNYQEDIAGEITLGFDVNGNGVVSADETVTVIYDETDLMAVTANKLQTALQGLGGALADVTIDPVTPTQYEIHFGDMSDGEDQPMITVESTNFTSGFLPAVEVEALREPVVLGPIYVSPDDASETAASIESAFLLTTTEFDIGPYEFPSSSDLTSLGLGPYTEPETIRESVPGVSVSLVYETVIDPDTGESSLQASLTEFEITFDGQLDGEEGAAAKINHPELEFVSAVDEYLNVVDIASLGTVETIKETSSEFRVNPEEEESVFTSYPDVYDQSDAVVAMDADGDFVIVWTSESADSDDETDVYARLFTPIGLSSPDEVEYVEGIMAKTDAFLVNTTTSGMQGDASVGMDSEGNFTIAWASGAQDLSYYNDVYARSYNRDGEALTNAYRVNTASTVINFNPFVSVSDDGSILITWDQTNDERYIQNLSVSSSVYGKIYDSDGNVLIGQFSIGGGSSSKSAWDANDDFIITWEANSDTDNTGSSTGVLARVWNLEYSVSSDSYSTTETITEFAVNSASYDSSRTATWPYYQGSATPAFDADGDLTIAFDGYGADVSNNVYIGYDFYDEASADPANADLLSFFINGFILSNAGSSYDIDLAIELELISAATQGATDAQLGRIRAILDEKATLLRGEANGVLYTQIDASAGSNTILYSDNIANAERDGSNTRYLMLIDSQSTSGSFVITLYNSSTRSSQTVTISPVYTNSVLNVSSTRAAIENALEGATLTGLNWPESTFEGSVTVRTVGMTEIQAREVTLEDGTSPWAYTNLYSMTTLENCAVYEITFQGEVHDMGVSLSMYSNSLSPTGDNYASVAMYQAGDAGTTQTDSVIDMETDGDFAIVWLQYEEYTSDYSGYYDSTGTANQNLYYRLFDESTDTAGASVTDLVDSTGNQVDNGETIEGEVTHIVVTFDEELLCVDPDDDSASVLNTDNWGLTLDGVAIPGAVIKVEFGMNKAAELAGTDDGMGGTYDLSEISTNKWEAVITLDASGSAVDGITALGIGDYQIIALSTIEDTSGNKLGATGNVTAGTDMVRSFSVAVDQDDAEVDETAGTTSLTSATLQPETANAVAVDDDGDYVVVWTAYDSSTGCDRVYMRLFDADGTPADLPIIDSDGEVVGTSVDAAPVMLVSADSAFDGDIQRHASVAMDPDGDFVITWTNYDNGDADIYARQFSSVPIVVTIDADTGLETITFADDVEDAFLVNDYTDDNQKWSDVAVDTDGDFVITWASYAQEEDGEEGTGYGIYARRYDSEGAALGKEFQVNVTTAGDQTTPSIAMAGDGYFVIAWTSDQNGTDDDIVVREFNADGSPVAGVLEGEEIVNDTTEGHQRYPDVAMSLDGDSYVVTWTDTAADGSGTSVWAEMSSAQAKTYVDAVSHQIDNAHTYTITVEDSFTIADLNVQLGYLYHTALDTLTVTLTSPSGTTVTLFSGLDDSGSTGVVMSLTTFDDEASAGVRIDDADAGAIVPYSGSYIPQSLLSAFDGENASGTWTLTITDSDSGDGNTGYLEAVSTEIGSWTLQITGDDASSEASFMVNTTTAGHQMYSSVAMDSSGDFVITWSGKGVDSTSSSGHDVYYQRYDEGGKAVGSETLVNLELDDDQWISSAGMDATGNFVIVWTGEGILPGSTALYKYDSTKYLTPTDSDGPIVTDMYSDAGEIYQGGVIVADDGEVTQVTVVFNEELSTEGGETGLYSVTNPDNWIITLNGVEIAGGIDSVEFGLNPLTNKWEAIVTFDGNGVNYGTPGLDQGTYVLTVRDSITDVTTYVDDSSQVVPGNFLDGDRDSVPGTQTFLIGVGGYEHEFSIADSAQIGPEFRINEDDTVDNVQQISETGGIGQGVEENNTAVAVDNDGDFAVVWTTYGLDDADDESSGGVYVRLFDRDDNAVTGEILVNQTTEGDQSNASIAMDADGDFVVVWQSENADGTYDIYARMYDSTGNAVTDEFLVNTTTNDNQVNPSVAMDDRGAFVITWASAGQDMSYFNDIYAQRYDRFGEAQGSEIQVNTDTLSTGITPGDYSINPVVAVSGATGDFVIAWEIVTEQTNGVATNSIIAGRLYDSNGAAQTDEIQLDSGAGSGGSASYRAARNPQLAMGDDGGFFLVWESYNGTDYDVYYREFSDSGSVIATGQANMAQFSGQQVNPSIAVDADGDFSIVWNGAGATADALDPTNTDLQVDEDDSGVFKIDYNASNETTGTQTRVNYTSYGDQSMATIAMEPDGDAIVVWTGTGVGDTQGIFARRYDEASDTAGPIVSDWADQYSTSLDDGNVFDEDYGDVTYFVLTFDEAMLETGDDSVTNTENYAILLDGIELEGAIVRVEYGLNLASELAGTIDPLTGEEYAFDADATNKYEVVITVDGDLSTSGLQGLEDGTYTLMALTAVPGVSSGLRDASGNVLYQTGENDSGDDFSATFQINSDGAEDYEEPESPELTETEVSALDLEAILVNQVTSDYQYTTAGQSVAVDNDGDFVVVWTRYDSTDEDGNPTDANIYARYYTDEVQRITLPDALSSDSDNDEDTLGSFSLEYAASEIQMISITAGIEPGTSGDDEVGQIEGSFVLGFDLTGDGTIGDDPSVQETVTIRSFSEDDMETNAATIQAALRSLGGSLEDVVVQAINPRDYLITFADATAGEDVPEITVESFQLTDAYLPAVSISTLREAMVFANITVSEDDPWETAAAIEAAFAAGSTTYSSIGPIEFPSTEEAEENADSGESSSYTSTWWTESVTLEVEVTPVVNADGTYSLTEFDITYTGTAGKQDHPELVISDATDDQGNAVTVADDAVETRKEPSNEFRVNPEEEEGEELNQTYATVAMDADGDFVVVWQSEVSDTDNYGSETDIYARMFSAFGTVAEDVEVDGEILDIYGGSSGVRAIINPEAEDVQRLIFDADDTSSDLTGTFRLQLGDVLTESITFDSTDLAATADDIEAKLADAGIEGVTVVRVSTTTTGRYRLEVRFGGESAGVDQPLLEYVADTTALAATVTVRDMNVDLYTIEVNQDTANAQFSPTVAMDDDGSFVVAWANGGQLLSYFNSISVQRFDSDGERVGNEFQVNTETTSIQYAPYVALSDTGNFLVTWSTTTDADYESGDVQDSEVYAKVFDADGNQLVDEFVVGTGGYSAATFDSDDNYVITWEGLFDTDAGTTNSGVHAAQYALYDDSGQVNSSPEITRDEFRVNSASTSLDSDTLWPYDQSTAQPAIDADGDLVIIYQGYGPDVSVDVEMAAGYFAELMGKESNSDLLKFFDPFDVYDRGQEGAPVETLTALLESTGDVDDTIDQILFRATELGATEAQLGRLRAILESTIGQLRGEANGILVSTWDTDPDLNSELTATSSDNVINSYRDGQNQSVFVEIPIQYSATDGTWYQAESGTFTIQVTNVETGEVESVDVTIASNGTGQPLNITGTLQNIETALESLTILGTAWEEEGGTVEVREVDPDEIESREGTSWEIEGIDASYYKERAGGVNLVDGYRNVLFEIVFQGSAHDTAFEVEIIASDTLRGGVTYDTNGNAVTDWVDGPAVSDAIEGDTYGLSGTLQTNASIGMERDGDYVAVYTQVEAYSNAGYTDDDSGTANSNIYYRRFDEETDTAGPMVSDFADANGDTIEDDAELTENVQYIVLTFDEEMLGGDPEEVANSVLNTANYILYESGAEVSGGIINVSYGLSKAAELAGQIDPLTGEEYDLSAIPSNKWEVVITVDSNPDEDGAQALQDGYYTIQVLSTSSSAASDDGLGLQDKTGNTLYMTGYDDDGEDFSRSFSISVTERTDEPVTDSDSSTSSTVLEDGHTDAESSGAIAADADGQYVVVWTATDVTTGLEQVYYRLYDADGTAADLPLVDSETGEAVLDVNGDVIVVEDAYPILPVTSDSAFAGATQGNATVAMDEDGDFVVTWTNTVDGDSDIYARQFDSLGELAGVSSIGNYVFKGGSDNESAVSEAFQVNTYTEDAQIWSDIAVDVDGDFVITWSSYGQEDDGSGYGVYARRYNSDGLALGKEFQVNLTESGNQRYSTVAMDSTGAFVIAWTSDQNGVSDDIVLREYNADGTAVAGPLSGEVIVNQTLSGDQRYPDIAMDLSGDQYVVTWASSGQDGSGWGVYARVFNRADSTLYVTSDTDVEVPDTGEATATVNISNNAIITDLNVQIELSTDAPGDLTVELISPDGTVVELFTDVPSDYANGTTPTGSNFSGTTFDDEATIAITDSDNGAVAPFAGTYQPTGTLSDFDGENVNGQWQLRITDSNGNDRSALLEQWTLIIEQSATDEDEFRVNTTTVGNQSYPSVAMDHQGEFVITWSGFGNQEEHEDESGSGVFLQRFESTGERDGSESRVNMTTDGDQQYSSVATDGVGNYYIAFTGVARDSSGANIAGETDVFVQTSSASLILIDNDPPIVTDVQLADGTQLLEGDVIDASTTTLVVVLGERMSTSGMTSIESLSNWSLECNGTELTSAIESVEFAWNALTRKYEATVTLDDSVLPLSEGEYTVTLSSVVTDGANSLDGDWDGVAGSDPTTTTQPGFQFSFIVSGSATEASVGPEQRVNTETDYVDTFSSTEGTGTALESSATTLAIDNDGDYVVVWTRYGTDDSGDSTGAGVYMRVYDRDDEPLTDEILVNTITEGDQRNPSVAMDADGDFVVVWESENSSLDGSYDIYARRFSSVGEALDSEEFLVNTETTLNQVNASVAMDNFGNFVVVWATADEGFGYSNDIYGQLYDSSGQALGQEFLINDDSLAGINPPTDGSFEINPEVAMSGATGSFVVTWEVVTAQQNGVVTDTVIAARQFTADGDPVASEFQADTGVGTGGAETERVARNPQIVVSDDDSFIIVWESYTGTDYDVFYQTFDSTGASQTSGQVNMTQFDGQQVNPSVAIDADGNFSVVFNGAGAEANALYPDDTTLYTDEDDEGVWVRSYDSTSTAVSVETRVNVTSGGLQQFATIAMEPDGDFVVAWSGRGVGDQQGIYTRSYDSDTDTVGPIVSGLLSTSGASISDGDQITEEVTVLTVVFDEEMMTSGAHSVTSASNYRLVCDGTLLSNVITDIEFGLNPDTNKWEAVLTLSGALEDGEYELTVRNSVQDAVGNPLGSTGADTDGTSATWTFNLLSIGTGDTGGETLVSQGNDAEFTRADASQPVASNDEGDTVTVWTSEASGSEGIYATLTMVTWSGDEDERVSSTELVENILVTDDATADSASVAMDGDGDFVVTWSQYSTSTGWDIYARMYDANGDALGDAFLVNSETDDAQRYSSVAMDEDGDFVITWQSNDQDGSGYGIYAQRFDAEGEFIGGTNEYQVISFVGDPTGTFQLKYNGKTTSTITYSGNPFAIADDVQNALEAIGLNVEVEAIDLENLGIRFLDEEGLQDQGQILVVNADITGDSGAKIKASTLADGDAGEFLVNDTTDNNQVWPSIGMDADGTFVISWTSYGQDGDESTESNIYAKQFVSNDAFLDLDGTDAVYTADSDSEDAEFVTTTEDPDTQLTSTNSGYDGVVQIVTSDGSTGTGSLLYTGRHILTAAHVVDDGTGEPVDSVDVIFELSDGTQVTMTCTVMYIHEEWTGDIFDGNDIAIIVLPEEAPEEADRYDIYRGSSELNQTFTIAGYGYYGQGEEEDYDGEKRYGYNVFEAYGESLNSLSLSDFGDGQVGTGSFDIPSGKVLVYDFDSGLSENDALGMALGIYDTGLGTLESSAAHGDSGGPAFINGVIAGVVSGGVEYTNADSTPDEVADVSYGTVGLYTRVSAFADWIDAIAQSTSSEFLVNENEVDATTGEVLVDNQTNDQKWSSVALDADGDFVITWTSYAPDLATTGSGIGTQDTDGVFARQYDSSTSAVSEVFQVNDTATGEQQYSRVAIDANGDFVITWESLSSAGYDIYAQRYAGAETVAESTSTIYGANGEIGSPFVVNTTTSGDQRYPGIAMNDVGDYVIVWSGYGSQSGEASSQGVFEQRFYKSEDNAGPMVSDMDVMLVADSSAEMDRLIDGITYDAEVSSIVITFGEALSTYRDDAGSESVLNLSNWVLTRDGEELTDGVYQVEFSLNSLTNKYEAVVYLDDDSDTAGAQALVQGEYVLTIRDSIEDLYGNKLDGDFDGTPGGSFSVTFTVDGQSGNLPEPGTPDEGDTDVVVNDSTDADQTEPAVARAADGSYVVVWTSENEDALDEDGEPIEDLTGEAVVYTNVYARMYDRYGEPTSGEILVTSYSSGNQSNPDVAIDEYGNFVVVWEGEGEDGDDEYDSYGIWARVFDANGNASGEQFAVNEVQDGKQSDPAVAMDGDGNFVVTWVSLSEGGIVARTFNLNGEATSVAFMVNTTTGNSHADPDVAMDDEGNYTIVWTAAEQDNGSMGIFAQRFNSSGSRLGSVFMVNQYQTDSQDSPRIAMDDDGNFIVVWQSFGQDTFGGYGIYARRYSSSGSALTDEFQVNDTTSGYQFEPSVSMDSDGDFVITWSSFNQEGDQGELYGIFAKMYNADGSDYVVSGATEALGEFRVNAIIEGDQRASDVSMDADGHYVVVWQGTSDSGYVEDADNSAILIPVDGTDIYSRVLDPDDTSDDDSTTLTLYGTPGADTFVFTAGSTPGTWVVAVNGVAQTVASTIDTITFDGLGGSDTVTFTGTSSAEKLVVEPGEVVFTGSNFTVNASNVEIISVDGAGGEDYAEIRDSDGDDTLIMKLDETTMVGEDYSITVLNFEEVYAYSVNGGDDVAKLYDTDGDDTFVGRPEYVRMTGDGYVHRAKGFRYAHGYSVNGGDDTAELYDSEGDDYFKHADGLSKMYGSGYYVRAKNFSEVNAYATAGGDDYARIFDTEYADTFVGTPTSARMYSAEADYDVTANLFDRVLTKSFNGGVDTAEFFDSDDKEIFVGNDHKATFSGDDFEIVARKFEVVEATSTPGSGDIAKFRDTEGDDYLVADESSAKMYTYNGDDLELLYTAFAFDQVKTYRSTGTDTKNVSDAVDYLLLDDGWVDG